MKKRIILILLAGTFFYSCQEQLDINTDPDVLNPSTLSLNGEFPAATTGVATSLGSYYAIIGGLWSQFYTQSALANQYKIVDDYSIGTNDFGGAWSSMYDALLDARNVKKLALEQENWNYFLMASVIEVYGFQVLTDMYGSVPYTEACDPNFLNPNYDEESVIYDGLASTLEDALSRDLSQSNTDIIPGVDDLVFGGDMNQWRRFANTLLLKVYLRQSNARPSVASSGVQSLLNSGAEFLDTDAAITQYEDQPDKSNPLYETNVRQLNVATNLRTSTTMYSYLTENSDERVDYFYTSGASQNQGDYNNPNGANVGVLIINATDPVYLLSAAESYFLQAEAQLKYGSGNVEELYNDGVVNAFAQFDLDGNAYISDGAVYEFPSDASSEVKLEAIIVQKWISFFPGKGAEAFIEQLRTGYPENSTVNQSNVSYVPGEWAYSVNGVTNGTFPKRIVYPQTELQNNSNFPGLTTITDAPWYQN